MKLLIKVKKLIEKLKGVFYNRRGEYTKSSEKDNKCYDGGYSHRIGDTTYLVSAVFRETGSPTLIDRISALLDSKIRYELSQGNLDAKTD